MKKAITILTLVFIGFSLSSQEKSTHPDIPFTNFGNFDVLGDYIVAIGTCDQVWTSKDHGQNWKIHTDIPSRLRDVAILPGQGAKAILVGGSSSILDFDQGIVEENDLGGIAWQVNVVGNRMYTYVRNDILGADIGTMTWDTIHRDTSDNDYIYITDASDNYLYMGMRQGRLLRMNLNSEEVEHMNNFNGWVQGLSMKNDSEGYLVSNAQSDVMKLTNGGLDAVVAEGFPEAIHPLAYGDMAFTVNTNRIYRSMDGGESSSRITTANQREFALTHRAKFTADGKLYLSGRGAMIAMSEDFGDTWTFLNAYNRSWLNAVDINSNGTGYTVGFFNTIIKTEDFGDSWTYMDLDAELGDNLGGVIALDDNKALIAANGGTFIIDGNQTTHKTFVQTDHVHQLANKTAIVALQYMDGVNSVARSTDGGQSWQLAQEIGRAYDDFHESSNGTLYFAGNESSYFKSSDNGQTWEEVETSFSSIRDVQFYNDNLGFIISGRDLNKTEDGGANWEIIGSGYSLQNLYIHNENTYLYTTGVNTGTNMTYTLDGGATFKSMYSNCVRTNDIHVDPDTRRVVLAHDLGHINITTLPSPTSTKTLQIEDLISVFPNPAYAGQEIQVKGEWEHASIYTLNGKLVSSQSLNSNSIPTNNISKGMYFIQLQNGTETKTTKLMLF